MIKKLFSKTFYSLSFLTFLMINGVDAMATATSDDVMTNAVAADSNCATANFCGTSSSSTPAGVTACSPVTQELIVTIKSATGGIQRSFYKCNGAEITTAEVWSL